MKKCFSKLLLKDKFILFSCFIVFILAYMYHLNQHRLLYHLGDEWGYWANAAYFNGYDWSGIAQYNGYYSFGYSIMLIPLFLIKNFEIRYLTALLINNFFQFLSFLLLKNVGEHLFPTLNKKCILIVSLCVTVYVSNIFFAKITLCECILYCTFICITYLIVQIARGGQWRHYVLLGLLSVYIFTIHMRALGVVLAVLFLLLGNFFVDKASRKKIFVCVMEISVLFIIALLMKEHLISKLYSSSDYAKGNDFSGQVSKIQLLLSAQGIKLLFRSIIGKFYYLLSASFLIIAWALVWIWEQIRVFLKWNYRKHASSVQVRLAFFFMLTFIFTMGISGIATIGESQRLDILIYGRYNEFIIGPLLLVGCCYLLNERKLINKKWMLAILAYFLCTIYVMKEFMKVTNPQIISTMIVGVAYLAFDGEKILYTGWQNVIALKSILISVLMMAFLKSRKIQIRLCGFIIVAAFWFHGGNWLLNQQAYIMNNYYTCKNIADYLIDNNIQEVIYVTNEKYDFFDYYRADILQYMCPDLDIGCQNVKNVSDSNSYALLARKGLFEEGYFDKYECVAISNDFELYVK